jgi:hypothetical protein
MAKHRKFRPEEALQLQEEIAAYLRWKSMALSKEFGELPFEQRFEKALREIDAEFFYALGDCCQDLSDQMRLFDEGQEQAVRWIAVQARVWLERNNQIPVTTDSIRKLTETIWAARRIGYKPGENLDFLSIDLTGGCDSLTIEMHRPPGIWSVFDYITALQYELAIPNVKLCKSIKQKMSSFPKTAWNRIWKSPGLSDLKRKRGAPKKQH